MISLVSTYKHTNLLSKISSSSTTCGMADCGSGERFGEGVVSVNSEGVAVNGGRGLVGASDGSCRERFASVLVV